MAFRSLVKITAEKEKERRRSTVRGSVLAHNDEHSASGVNSIFSFGGLDASGPGRRKSAYGLLEDKLSKSPTQAAEQLNPPEPIADCIVEKTLPSESTPADATDSRETTHYKRAVNIEPPPGLRTYKWAEERLSKSAALAGANWDQPEALEYIRRVHRRAKTAPGRKRSVVHVARPSSASLTNIALPQELPPSLEQPGFSERPQSRGIKQTEESTVQPVRSLQTEELVPTHRLQTLSRAGETTATAAQLAISSDEPCVDDSFAVPDSKPTPAWADAPIGDTEKPPAKCNCVLM